MRFIVLKSFRLEGQTATYRELLKLQIERPVNLQQGMNVAEMRMALKLMDKLDAATDVFALEDAEWEFVKRKIESAGWIKADRGILQFCDDVVDALSVAPSMKASAAHNGHEAIALMEDRER